MIPDLKSLSQSGTPGDIWGQGLRSIPYRDHSIASIQLGIDRWIVTVLGEDTEMYCGTLEECRRAIDDVVDEL